jgi:spermidine synthase
MYEIDPAVVKSSIDRSDYFSFVNDAKNRGVNVDIILGDGRLQFLKAPDASYDLIFMDAFTSDAVPVHLLTREAFDIYLKKLAPGGIIVLNIANRYLNFEHVLGNMTEDRNIVGMIQGGYEVREIDKYGTNWVVMARKTEDFGVLPELKAELKTDSEDWVETWRKIESNPKLGVWTDDYSNLPSIFKWSR